MSENHLSAFTLINIECSHCGRDYETSQCLWVDLERSSELRELLEANKLNHSVCPNCDEINEHLGPMLILQRRKTPHLLYVTSSFYGKENSDNLEFLFFKLKEHAGSQWKDVWSEARVKTLELRFLPYVYQQFVKCKGNETIAPLQLKLFELLQANPEDRSQVISFYPKLVSSGKTIDALEKMILFSEQLGDSEISALLMENKVTMAGVIRWANNMVDRQEEEMEMYEDRLPDISSELAEAIKKVNIAEAEEDYYKAFEACLVTYRVAKKEGNPFFIARFSGWFLPWERKVDPLDAKLYFEQIIPVLEWSAKELRLKSKDCPDYQLIHMNLGNIYLGRKTGSKKANIEKSILFSSSTVHIAPDKPSIHDVSKACHNLGAAYEARLKGDKSENYELAIQYFEKAQSLRDPAYDARDIAGTNNGLGSIYCVRIQGSQKKNLEKAIEYFDKAIDFYRENAHYDDLADVLTNLSNTYTIRIIGGKAENTRKAIELCEEALEIHSGQYPSEQRAKIFGALANAYFDRLDGDLPENIKMAITHNQEAISILESTNNQKAIFRYQINLANAHGRFNSKDEIETAIHYYKQALNNHLSEYNEHKIEEVYFNLATVLIKRTEGDEILNCREAIKYCQKAKKTFTRIKHPAKWAYINFNLGRAYSKLSTINKQIDYTNAVKHFKYALEVFLVNEFPGKCRETQSELGDLFLENDEWKKAAEAYTSGIEAGEIVLLEAINGTGSRREIGLNSSLYSRLAYCKVKLGNINEALIIADSGKTRSLVESIEIDNISNTLLPKKPKQQIDSLSSAVKELEYKLQLVKSAGNKDLIKTTIADLIEKREKLNAFMEKIRGKLSESFSHHLTVPEYTSLIPSDGAILAPIITLKGTLVFVLSDKCDSLSEENIIWIDEFTDDDFKTLLVGNNVEGKFSGWFGNYDSFTVYNDLDKWANAIDYTCSELWDKLFVHIHGELQKRDFTEDSHIIIVPQGGLSLLPLHAAFRDIDGKRRYLIEDYNISYIPSGQVLKQCLQRSKQDTQDSNSMLAVVNPTSDLNYANDEWYAIKKYFKGDSNIKALLNESATVGKVKEEIGNKSYLHFACHGFYDWSSPEKSSLILANKEVLSLSYIKSNLDLKKTRLAVLSACETGVIDITMAPDEFVSLPAGLIQVGVTAVLSTLWAIDDRSTQVLMQQFYKRHIADGKSIPESLRLAQKESINNQTNEDSDLYDHPFFWAAFMVVGV